MARSVRPTPGPFSTGFLGFAALAAAAWSGFPSAAGGADPAGIGRWLEPFDGQVPAVNLAVLPDGRVLYYSGVEADESDTDPTHLVFLTSTPVPGESRVWDPATGEITTPLAANRGGGDLFCSGITVRADGRVMAVGGSEWYVIPDTGVPVKGLKDTRFFDADAWTPGPDMAVRRWYPTVIELPDGDALVASGIKNLTDPSTHTSLVERFDDADGAWAPIASNAVATFGDVEVGPMNLPLYPRLFLMAGGPYEGRVFYQTTGTMWGPFGERPEEALWSLQQVFDPEAATWTVAGPSLFGARQHGAVVPLLLDPGRDYAPELLSFGGTLERSLVATPAAELADLSTAPPTNRLVPPMHHPRWHLNGVLLPDGTVLAVGGGTLDNVVVHGQENPPVLEAERYDPQAGAWEPLAAMQVPRMYHSTAVLLPDGRVLAGGHVPLPNPSKLLRDTINPQVVETRFEIYEPPYLFLKETRPAIESAPASLAYDVEFEITVANLGELHSVVLVRPGATTHAWDADQRGIRLDASLTGPGTLTVRSPPQANVAPPGTYMLFVNEDVDGQAFPSRAASVRVG